MACRRGPGPVHGPVEPPHCQHHPGVISLTGDPLTPHRDAIAMTRDLARARLLTIDGFGHTELPNPSTCAIGYEVARCCRLLHRRVRTRV